MRRILTALTLSLFFSLTALADPFVFASATTPNNQSGGRFDNTSALARDPYWGRVTLGSTSSSITALTLNPATLDLNNPVGSVKYDWQANTTAFFDVNAGASATITLGQITRTVSGTPAAITNNIPFLFASSALKLTLGSPGDLANQIVGQLVSPNTLFTSWGGNLSTTGLTSGGGYVDPGDNINNLAGTLSYVFPNQVINITLNPTQWSNNVLTVTATVTSAPTTPAPVPEPATLLLLASGIAGIALRRKVISK